MISRRNQNCFTSINRQSMLFDMRVAPNGRFTKYSKYLTLLDLQTNTFNERPKRKKKKNKQKMYWYKVNAQR